MVTSHDLDLSGSRNVIGHVTIRFPIGHFLSAASEFFGKTHRLATIHTLQTTDRRNIVLVRSAKSEFNLDCGNK